MKKSILFLYILSILLLACNSGEINKESTDEQTKELTENEVKKYKEKGLNFAMLTQKALGENLMKQIKINGTREAVSYCNLNALSIVDSMENVLNIEISRITDKPRNSFSQASIEELKYIETFKYHLSNEKILQPLVKEVGDKISFYSPIKTNGMCLQCHGNKESNIKYETLSVIDSLYPEDKAKGYLSNQIRGMWKIEFEK